MMNIIDTHVHVWDLDNYRLPWLDGEGPTLKRTWSVSDYAACQDESHGYHVEQAVYIEVDMAHDERERENELACKMVSDPSCIYGAASSRETSMSPALTSTSRGGPLTPRSAACARCSTCPPRRPAPA